MAGLRRDEIDKLGWSSFRWAQGVLRLELTEHFAGKTIATDLGVKRIHASRAVHYMRRFTAASVG
jgi:hypothetical protein